jgi:hypothetical protein
MIYRFSLEIRFSFSEIIWAVSSVINLLPDTLLFVMFMYAVSGVMCRLVVIAPLPQNLSAQRLAAPLANVGTVKYSKTITVTGLGGLWGCEMLRIPHCLDNRLTDGDKVVSPTQPPRSTLQKHYFVSGTHFC